MAHLKVACLLALVLSGALAYGEIRVARSPQFGGFSQARAQAQAGGFGSSNFGPRLPVLGPRPPIFGPRPPIFGPRPPVFGGGLGSPGRSISISKSISISSGGGGGGGGATSSANSNAFGK